ncbi:MAG: glycosyltransferase family 4 protein [Patescibacteria group bacterium]
MVSQQEKSIAIVVCSWPPQGGGIGNNAYYQAIKLAERGYPVGVFTPNFSGLEPISGSAELFKMKTVCHWGKAGFMFGLLKQLKAYRIVHLYYPFFGSDLLVWWQKRINPKTKLFLHYEMDPIGEGIKSWIFWLYLKLFLGRLIRAADKIGVLSFDHARNSYLAPYLQIWPEKFVELPNGVDTEIFRPLAKDAELMKLNKISVQDKVLIFVGGLDRQHYFKGVPILLSAFKMLPQHYFPDVLDGEVRRGRLQELRGEAKLLIVGDGDCRAQFESQAKKLGIADRVIFAGWVRNEALPRYYALADVFVLPSTAKTESFGIVAAEAQACGLAAAVADWPGVRSTIIDGRTGYLVEPSNADDLAAKLKLLLNDGKTCRAFGEVGRSRAIEKYDWSRVLDNLEKIYEQL